jgi:aldehyde dehydrogenase (NAD+)
LSIILREPMGVVAAIAPYNAPLVLLVKMIAFALAAGNTIVAKPSEATPLTAVALGRLLQLPMEIVTGDGAAGEALVDHPLVRGVAFTGSSAVGARIAERAARRMCRLQLELGGKNALLVLADMDPARAAAIAAEGAFYHAGQICMAPARLLVEDAIHDRFVAALKERAEALHLGDLRDERTAYGPLIHEAALRKVASHVHRALEEGADLVTGGGARGLVYRPTVLTRVPERCEAWREETFGPVVCVRRVGSLDEAIDVANDSPYGLSAGILTRDLERALVAARRLRAGAVHVGSHSFQTNALAPIGGYGMSGVGRSGGRFSVEAFTEVKWVTLETGALPVG